MIGFSKGTSSYVFNIGGWYLWVPFWDYWRQGFRPFIKYYEWSRDYEEEDWVD